MPPYQRLSAAVAACETIAPSPERIEDAEPFVYDSTGSRPLFVHVLSPEPMEGPAPAVLFFLGGGWRVGQVTQFLDKARAFCARASEAGRVCEIHEFAGQGHGLINNRETATAIGTSPFAATLASALAFLADIGITR